MALVTRKPEPPLLGLQLGAGLESLQAPGGANTMFALLFGIGVVDGMKPCVAEG